MQMLQRGPDGWLSQKYAHVSNSGLALQFRSQIHSCNPELDTGENMVQMHQVSERSLLHIWRRAQQCCLLRVSVFRSPLRIFLGRLRIEAMGNGSGPMTEWKSFVPDGLI